MPIASKRRRIVLEGPTNVPKAAAQDVFWSDVVLQVKKIVAGSVFGGVRARRLLFDDGEGALRQLLDARQDGR